MGELAARTIFSNETGPLAGVGLDTLAKNQAAILELEGAQAPQSRTISNGSISPTASYVIVDTEGGAAADDLSVISPVLSASENLHTGMIVNLKAADSGRVVTVKNSGSANGINTYDGNDYVLSPTHWLKLQLRADLKWYEVEGRAMETALAAAGASSGLAQRMDAVELIAANAKAVTDLATETPGAGKIPKAGTNGKLDPRWCGTPSRLFASFNTSEPDGLLANGGAYSRTTYADLFAILGTSFGAGDGSTTFNVPDFRGRTLQGANGNLKAVLAAGLPNLYGVAGATTAVGLIDWNSDNATSGAFKRSSYVKSALNVGTGQTSYDLVFDAHAYNNIYGASTTVQTPAIATNIFIKY